MNFHRIIQNGRGLGNLLLLGFALVFTMPMAYAVDPIDIANRPLFLGGNGAPLALLVMGRDHKLYYEAYNDASDLNQDGEIDVGYKPALQDYNILTQAYEGPLNYYGYFDSYKCYNYENGVFVPKGPTDQPPTADHPEYNDKRCTTAGDYWSGDFLNYVTTSRMDALRRVLYGGYRSTDTATDTVLERARIPQDAHSWGKEYESITRDGYDIRQYSPLALPTSGTRHLLANVTLKDDTDQKSLLRVLTNSNYRIWNWVAISVRWRARNVQPAITQGQTARPAQAPHGKSCRISRSLKLFIRSPPETAVPGPAIQAAAASLMRLLRLMQSLPIFAVPNPFPPSMAAAIPLRVLTVAPVKTTSMYSPDKSISLRTEPTNFQSMAMMRLI